MQTDLDRFIKAQEEDYERVFQEIRNGRKITHWMWYIFPQIVGLGVSDMAQYYGIQSLEEAKAYLENEILGKRLIKISKALLNLNTSNPVEIFGYVDSLKLKSSMTLFLYVSDKEIFSKVLERYFGGAKDDNTIKISENLKD